MYEAPVEYILSVSVLYSAYIVAMDVCCASTYRANARLSQQQMVKSRIYTYIRAVRLSYSFLSTTPLKECLGRSVVYYDEVTVTNTPTQRHIKIQNDAVHCKLGARHRYLFGFALGTIASYAATVVTRPLL